MVTAILFTRADSTSTQHFYFTRYKQLNSIIATMFHLFIKITSGVFLLTVQAFAISAVSSDMQTTSAHKISQLTTERVLPQPAHVPGGIALLVLPDYEKGMTVQFNNQKAAVLSYKNMWIALGGIPLSAKAGEQHVFSANYKNGFVLKSRVTIKAKKFPEQHLTISNKRKVNPNAEDLKRISAESIRKKRAKAHWSDPNPRFDFIWPVNGRTSSTFGLRRFFNEQERRPHSGLDIAAKEGTPIAATASGTVIESGDFFFSGNMIYIDHGQGIISLYAHLNQISVKPGDIIRQGDIIGTVGQTGRVTGPHLHFAILANKTLIDPLYLLSPKK